MEAIDNETAARLTAWRGNVGFLGAWLDLALDRSRTVWTEFDLTQRWRREWSPERCRAWIAGAVDLGLMIPSLDSRGWTIVGMTECDSTYPATVGSDSSLQDHPAVPHEGVISEDRLAAALLARVPALRSLDDLERRIFDARLSDAGVTFSGSGLIPLEDVERSYVVYAIGKMEGNKSQVAQSLGIDPSTLYRKLSRWGVA